MNRAGLLQLERKVVRTIEAVGLNWRQIERGASQIIVFGSHALSVNTESSDLDVLCIGKGMRHKSRMLHLIWVSESRTRSDEWPGSELATHVAAYGKWIKGSNTWGNYCVPSSNTVRRKEQRIINRAVALNRHWEELLPGFQSRQMTKLRRDLQRFILMRKGMPSVPKAVLDREWNQKIETIAWTNLLSEACQLCDVLRRTLRKAGQDVGIIGKVSERKE